MKTHLLLCNLRTGKVGAYEMFLTAFAEALSPDRLVVALAGVDSERVSRLFVEKGIIVELIPQWQEEGVPKPWGMVLPSLRLMRKWNPATVAIHFGNEFPTIALRVLAAITGNRSRWIWHQHQQVRVPSVITTWVNRLRLMSLFVDHLVAVYDGGRVSLEKRGVPHHKITVVHNGMVDHEVSKSRLSELRASLELAAHTNVVLTVGWLVKRKRIDWLLDAWQAVVSRMPDSKSKLLIVGDGPERQALERLAQQYGVEASVMFLGERGDVRDLLALGDLYAHTSIAETCTYTVTESMCAGIPAVVTEAGAAHEQIADRESGFVTAPEDNSRFSDCLVELLSSPEKRRQMGKVARARWQQGYRLRNALQPLLTLYGARQNGMEKGAVSE